MGYSEIITAVVQLGLSVGLCVFFVWRDWEREKASNTRIEGLEKFARTTLMKIAEDSTTHISLSQSTLDRVVDVLERLEPHLVKP